MGEGLKRCVLSRNIQHLAYSLQHSVFIRQDVNIPKPQNDETRIFQFFRSGDVSCAINMLSTIKLNDELRIRVEKISDIIPNRNLPSEFCSAELSSS